MNKSGFNHCKNIFYTNISSVYNTIVRYRRVENTVVVKHCCGTTIVFTETRIRQEYEVHIHKHTSRGHTGHAGGHGKCSLCFLIQCSWALIVREKFGAWT